MRESRYEFRSYDTVPAGLLVVSMGRMTAEKIHRVLVGYTDLETGVKLPVDVICD